MTRIYQEVLKQKLAKDKKKAAIKQGESIFDSVSLSMAVMGLGLIEPHSDYVESKKSLFKEALRQDGERFLSLIDKHFKDLKIDIKIKRFLRAEVGI